MPESLFGHIAMHFSPSPENLATEALNFILNRSQVSRDAFSKLFQNMGIPVPGNLKFETQANSNKDTSRPDLIAKDSSGKTVLLGEVKFWAGLTENQPVTYLERLISQDGIALVFIAPSLRTPTLWPELVRRCIQTNLAYEQVLEDNQAGSETCIAKINCDKFLVLTSWRVVLASIQHALELELDREMLSNLSQLQGLCEEMDTTAFLPIRSEELTADTGRRVTQYAELVEEIFNALMSKKLAAKGGYMTGGSMGTYIRFMRFADRGCSVEYNPKCWYKYAATPVWLGIHTASPSSDPYDKDRLVSLELEEPRRLFQEGRYLYIPLYIPTGVEKPQIIDDIVQQIMRVKDLLIQ